MDNNLQQNQRSRDINNDTLKKPKISAVYSWPVIILAIIIFWPIGLFLLWKRASIDKKASLTMGKVVAIFGYVFLSCSLLGVMVSLSEGFTSDDVSAIMFFSVAGIALILLGNSMKKNAQRYKKYLSIIVNHNITSIDSIAEECSVSYDTAKKDIQKMVDRGYFAGAYINDGTRELVLPRFNTSENIVQDNYEQNLQTKVVTCKSCGANNTVIVGRTSECEFCGSPID